MRKGFSSKNILFYIATCASILFSFNGFAQQKKPKIALVLSGGGAKGIAHIPLLQTLDSLNIVPDLIVGNSMGSVVGGLYAMGYSGDSIAAIVKQANWEELIGGRVSLKNVSVEEKTEFNRYLVEMDYVKGKVGIGKFLLNDQNLRQFISLLTFPSYNIDDFDKLPIPFRAVATDIVNGRVVVLKSGSLAIAMRASMSLPGVFSPVPFKETLLVDGAILNNFPVDVAKDMGADFIIGSDVGDGMMGKKELESISSLLFQAGMMSSHLKNPKNRELCDILINHTEHLTYGTTDFQRNQEIYKEGKLGVADNREALLALSERLKDYRKETVEIPFVREQMRLDTIVYKGISRTNMPLVKARTNINSGQIYTKQELIDGINSAMGTTIFSQITFEPFSKSGKLGLQFNGFERSKHQVKGSLHYDSFHGVGILVNYTGRNILGAASRSLVTLDVAEQPRFRVQHQKNFGDDRNWWWRTEALGQRLTHEAYLNNRKEDEVRYRYFEFENQVNRNITSMTSYVGFNVNYQNSYLKPKLTPEVGGTSLKLKSYSLDVIQVGAHFVYNTLNMTSFPTDGASFKVNFSRSVNNKVEMQFSDSNAPKENGSLANFSKVGLDYEKRFPLNGRITAILGATGNFLVVDDEEGNDVSFSKFGLGAKYTLGGNQPDPRKDNFALSGIQQGEIFATQFTKINLGLQYNFKPKLYAIPHVDMALIGFGSLNNYVNNMIPAKGHWQDYNDVSFLFTSGVTLGYNSILGPVTFDVSWVNDVNKVRVFFGVGFPLNRSN
ncbi:patatin-like phospholipase family protein [Flavobacterium antarcticum]|uniref:patatin-like phospholipase family protein n=1 Tax=Flavobacterium antarcticum TaxID=271155 RepID=UPI0003B506A8|nr:patatin-like phospholipase family protein [Flavobacterium antarcticum]